MSELAQKQVTPDTYKSIQKIFLFCFKYLIILNGKLASYLYYVKEKLE